MALAITAIVSSLAVYLAMFGLRGMNMVITPRMLRHAAILGAVLMVVLAAGHILSIYDLVHSEGGRVYGATYTDVEARVPALLLLTVIALLSAAGMVGSIFYRGFRLMAASFSLWAIVAVLAGVVFPLVFQRLQVSPQRVRQGGTFHRPATSRPPGRPTSWTRLKRVPIRRMGSWTSLLSATIETLWTTFGFGKLARCGTFTTSSSL